MQERYSIDGERENKMERYKEKNKTLRRMGENNIETLYIHVYSLEREGEGECERKYRYGEIER